jgi:hypothetical protein
MARFRVNSPAVIHQTFESEVVIVNLETGDYFSLRGSGPEIWDGVVRHLSEDEIAANFSRRGEAGAGPEEIEEGVRVLCGELLREGLIVPTEAQGKDASGADVRATARCRPYRRPVFEKFTDMRELLLLDPIHELDEMGWPKPAGGEMAGER